MDVNAIHTSITINTAENGCYSVVVESRVGWVSDGIFGNQIGYPLVIWIAEIGIASFGI